MSQPSHLSVIIQRVRMAFQSSPDSSDPEHISTIRTQHQHKKRFVKKGRVWIKYYHTEMISQLESYEKYLKDYSKTQKLTNGQRSNLLLELGFVKFEINSLKKITGYFKTILVYYEILNNDL